MKNKNSLLKYMLLPFFLLSVVSAQVPTYLNPNASIDNRVNDLLERMTLEEKIGQMTQADHNAISNLEDINTYFLGSVLSGGGSDPANGNSATNWADLNDLFQSKALATRLSIPLIYGIDAVHGHSNVEGAVIFPHNIGLGATRNPELMREMARVTAIEIAATGIDWTFAPCVAVPRDERWGRTYEGFSENPELVALLTSPTIEGLQNDSLNSETSIVSCAKHFIGDGGTTNGYDQGNTEMTEEELRRIHLPGYIAAINSGARTIMASYSSWNGDKLHGHKYLLTDVLKTELGFSGFIISDWAAIDQIPGDYETDVEIAINAGVDMVMVPNQYVNFINILKSLVNQNRVTIDRINDAVRRILKVKFEFGIFEAPYANRNLLSKVGSAEHRAVAKQCVSESVVLLKKNDNVLPLPKFNIRVLVAGKHADDIGRQSGGWTIQWQGATGNITEGTSILEGLKKVAPTVDFVYDANGNYDNTVADYAIVVIGEDPYAEGDGDREDLSLSKEQVNLVRKFKNLGIPVVTILISGRPMIINPVLHNSDAFLAAWLPGTEADGIAEIIFGDFTPKGLLPMTWPKHMEQIPLNYGDENYYPLFPYDFGITSFNDSQVGSAPVFHSGMITEDGRHIELAFNKEIFINENTTASFTIQKNGLSQTLVTSIELNPNDNKMILIELDEVISKDDRIVISYDSGNISSKDGGVLGSFQNEEVINALSYFSQFHTIPGKIEAEDYSNMSGVQSENTSDINGGFNIGWIDSGDWLEYKCKIETTGSYFINYRIASESQGGELKLLIDGNEINTNNIPVTGGWQNWQTVASIVDLESGEKTIRLYASKGGFNLNWFNTVVITDVEENTIPNNFSLSQNHPNPFNPTTQIHFSIPEITKVQITIYNALGQQVAELVNQEFSEGNHSVTFNAANLSSGLYFYRLNSAKFSETKKMVLLK